MARRLSLKTRAKRYVARKTGIPTTRSGRKAKARRLATGGCMMYVLPVLAVLAGMIALILGAAL